MWGTWFSHSSVDGHFLFLCQFLSYYELSCNWMHLYSSFLGGGPVCLFLLDKHLGMELLGHRVGVCLMYVEEIGKLLPSGELTWLWGFWLNFVPRFLYFKNTIACILLCLGGLIAANGWIPSPLPMLSRPSIKRWGLFVTSWISVRVVSCFDH